MIRFGLAYPDKGSVSAVAAEEKQHVKKRCMATICGEILVGVVRFGLAYPDEGTVSAVAKEEQEHD